MWDKIVIRDFGRVVTGKTPSSNNPEHFGDAYARKHHNNLDEIVADLRKREKSHPDRIVDRRFHRTASNLQK